MPGLGAIVLLVIGATLYNLFMPVSVVAPWQYTVVARDLPNISAVEADTKGGIYALLEDSIGQGYLLRLHHGVRERVLDGLDKPDGMIIYGDDLIISEEVGNGRLIRFTPSDHQSRILARLLSAEGIAVDQNGSILVVEDRNPGRLVRIEKNGDVVILLDDLDTAEGVCIDRMGRIYIAEKENGRILLYANGIKNVLLEGLHKPGVVNCAINNDLWITEDRTNSGRLLNYHNSRMTTIASRLHNPQGISFDANGRLLLAEQGRGRILAFTRKN
ncbi:MAG: YncE family protein [Gammaproteobacteria bacterium]|nr:MAG: YncE family protein [Gammaproteobacteria bacterium]